jgi:hypothetical protein
MLGSFNFRSIFSSIVSDNYLSFISIALSYVLGMVIDCVKQCAQFGWSWKLPTMLCNPFQFLPLLHK